MTGRIMRILRLRMGTDGNGISTLIVFAGCPLECRYCINDECHIGRAEAGYMISHDVQYSSYEPEELAEALHKDDIYYKMSGGGITFGGGEPLMQVYFIKEACRQFDPAWAIRVETSLYVPWAAVEYLVGIVDEWIIDIKDMNPEIYQSYTGRSPELMTGNLKKLLKKVPAEKLLIRVPHIPHYNTPEDVNKSKRILEGMGVTRIDEFTYIV